MVFSFNDIIEPKNTSCMAVVNSVLMSNEWVPIDCEERFTNMTFLCERQLEYKNMRDYLSLEEPHTKFWELNADSVICPATWIYIIETCMKLYPYRKQITQRTNSTQLKGERIELLI